MLKTAGWLLPAILALAGCSSSGQRHEQTLSQALATISQDKALVGASSGVMVRDADSGTVLYQAHAQQRLAPASNMKMFTSLAAFGVLGADYRFETRLLTTGEQRGDTLQGISICRAAAIRRCIRTISTPSPPRWRSAAFARFMGG